MNAGRLLVVDDEPRFRDFVGRAAVKLGFDVERAADGRAFKSLYKVFDPDVAVIDIVMPGVDGLELVQWLAERGATLHVVIVTGLTPDYSTYAKKLGEAKGLGSVTSLTKPVRLAELQEVLTRIGVKSNSNE